MTGAGFDGGCQPLEGRRDRQLGACVEREVHFPNSMVDRITPVTTDGDRDELAERLGLAERLAGGVRAVYPVGRYELMKLRLLNASHQALCYLGHLAGLYGGGSDTHARAGARGRPRRLPARTDRPLLQPARPGHRRPTLLRQLRPHPQVAAAGPAREPGERWGHPSRGDGRGELGALLRGRRRAGPTDRRGRPVAGPARRRRAAPRCGPTRLRGRPATLSATSAGTSVSSRRTCRCLHRCTDEGRAPRWPSWPTGPGDGAPSGQPRSNMCTWVTSARSPVSTGRPSSTALGVPSASSSWNRSSTATAHSRHRPSRTPAA